MVCKNERKNKKEKPRKKKTKTEIRVRGHSLKENGQTFLSDKDRLTKTE